MMHAHRRQLGVLVAALAAALSVACAAATASPAAAAPARVAAFAVAPACDAGYYRNVDGRCVHRPSSSPKGATAQCRDRSYSYSRHASGTCSGHGGVARWIHHP